MPVFDLGQTHIRQMEYKDGQIRIADVENNRVQGES
jgi:hypothetical protein